MASNPQIRSRRSTSVRLRLEALEAREVPAIIGTIDPTFEMGGIVQTGVTVKNTVDIQLPSASIGFNGVLPQGAMAIDSLGRTVVVGDGGDWVTRLNPDGSVDTTFGNAGSVNLASYGFSPVSVAIDAASNVVILGETVHTGAGGAEQVQPVLIRLTPTGSLDPTFGTNGIVDVTLPDGGGSTSPLWVRGLAIDAEGRIVVVGGGGGPDYPTGLEVFRLTPNGQLDSSFGRGGVVGSFLPTIAAGVSLDAAGQIVVAGSGSSIVYPQPSVIRLNPDGSIDPALSGGASPPSGSPLSSTTGTFTTAVATDSAGDIYLGGSTDGQGYVIKLTAAGVVDTTFGTDGVYTSPLLGPQSTGAYIGSLAVLPNGEVIAAQQSLATTGAPADLAVFELTTSGTLDKTFNPGGATPGVNEFSLNGGQSANGLSGLGITPNGDIEVLGFSGSTNALAVARLIGPTDPNATPPVPPVASSPIGTLDPTFNNGALVQTGIVTVHDGYPSAVVDSSGRTILLGGAGGLEIQRLNPDGSPDLTFGKDGESSIFVGAEALPAGLAVDAAGDIFIASSAPVSPGMSPTGPQETEIIKFTSSGILDTSFGNDGIAVINPSISGGWGGEATLLIDPSGNVDVVGFTAGGEVAVVRLTPSGTVDPTFNGGNVDVVPGTSNVSTDTATIDSSGRIVIAGKTNALANTLFVTRLNPDGSLDTTFAGTGLLNFTLTPGSRESVSSVATDSAGNIFLGGSNGVQQVVVKLTSSGSLDSSFGTGGFFTNPGGSSSLDYGPNPIVGLVVLPNDEVIAGGSINPDENENTSQFVVFELTASGQLDPTFNADGPTPGENIFGSPAGSVALSMVTTPSGDLVIAGYGGTGVEYGMQVARLIGPDDARVVVPVVPAPGPTPPVLIAPVFAVPGITPSTNPFASLGVSVRTAIGDVNGDGTPDTIYVTGPGTLVRVEVISGTDGSTVLVPAFDPFGDNFTGGAWVVAADFNHSGRDQIVIAADVGGGPQIVIWSLLPDGQMQQDASFYGITDPNFRGGTRIAVGDVNDDGTPDLVVAAGYGGGPRVAVFDGTTLLSGNPTKLVNDFYVFESSSETSLRNGLYVAVGDVNGDGYADLIFGAGSGGGPRVLVLSGKILIQDGAAAALAAPLANFFVGGSDSSRSGVAVAVTTDANDGVADIVAGLPAGTVSVPLAGQKGTKVPVYAGSTLTPDTQPTPAMSIDPTTDIVLSGVFVG